MVKKNEICEAEFTGYTSEGLAVARVDGEAVFVPNAIAGERARIRILKAGQTSAYGKLETLLERSPHRTEPVCPISVRCGGCAFQHMDYEEECRLKAQRVEDALTRIGGLSVGTVSITGSPQTESYRNKAQYPVGLCAGKADAGFYRQRSHEIIPVERCAIQSEQADLARGAVVAWMRRFRIAPYDELSGTGLVRHIFVRCGFASGETLVCVVVNGDSVPHEAELTRALREAVPGLRTVVLNRNEKRGNTVLGAHFRTLWGPGYIEDVLCGLRFRLSPRTFYQVNRAQAERLYEKAIALAGLDGTQTVLDLYCGAGTITLCMAKRAKHAIGVELVEEAIRDAQENAERNGITNARFFCADAGKAARRLAEEGTKPDVIVVDPPRKGVSADVIEAICEMAPERVVYVSCDPATLARDAALLTARGYTLSHAEAFDLFPRCAHVETVVQLSKGERSSTPLRVELDGSDVDFASLREDATYPQIKNYVLERFDLKVTSLQIAQTKRKYGLQVGTNHNVSKKVKPVVPQCPLEKETAIREALLHFQMI